MLAACKSNKMIPACFVGCGITKLYMILFSTFWLLYIESFYPDGQQDGYKEAKQIYSNVMIVSVVFGVIFVPLFGKVADVCNPQWVLPFGFFCRALTVIMFYFSVSPNGYYAYGVSVLMVLCTGMENITVDCLILRASDKEVRGVIFGVANACGYMGQLCFAMGGGALFDSVGPKAPFILMGGLDLTFALITSTLGICGVIRNDMLEKEIKRRLDAGY